MCLAPGFLFPFLLLCSKQHSRLGFSLLCFPFHSKRSKLIQTGAIVIVVLHLTRKSSVHMVDELPVFEIGCLSKPGAGCAANSGDPPL